MGGQGAVGRQAQRRSGRAPSPRKGLLELGRRIGGQGSASLCWAKGETVAPGVSAVPRKVSGSHPPPQVSLSEPQATRSPSRPRPSLPGAGGGLRPVRWGWWGREAAAPPGLWLAGPMAGLCLSVIGVRAHPRSQSFQRGLLRPPLLGLRTPPSHACAWVSVRVSA